MIGTLYDGIFKSMLYLTEILKGFHCQYVHAWKPTVYLIRLRWSLSKWYSIQKLSNILRKYVKKSKQEDQIVEDVESEQDYSTNTVHIK